MNAQSFAKNMQYISPSGKSSSNFHHIKNTHISSARIKESWSVFGKGISYKYYVFTTPNLQTRNQTFIKGQTEWNGAVAKIANLFWFMFLS